MIYKQLNNFMIESSLKSPAWDYKFMTWLKRNYPGLILKNDSNLWECLKESDGNIVSTYKQIKLFLKDEIDAEENLTRLKNLVCINCFGINIEETMYLIDEMKENFECFSTIEKNMYDALTLICTSISSDVLRSYNSKYENSAISVISKIRATLKNNYKRLIANCIDLRVKKFDNGANGIKIHYFNDEKFQIIVGVVSSGKNISANTYKGNKGLSSYLENLSENLSSGSGMLCANLISNENIGLFSEGDIIFGYEYIPIRKVLGMNTGECFRKVDNKLVLDNLYFDSPKSLLKHMSGNAVEVILDMRDEPVMPSFIVSIDEVKESDADAAKMLNLPIYVINSKSCFEYRRKFEENMIEGLDKIDDEMSYLRLLLKIYKYQEQSFMINTGIFSRKKEEMTARLDETYNKIGNCIRGIYNKCVFDDNLSIKKRFDNMEKLMTLNEIISDISLINGLNSKTSGNNSFKCFFTEYSSHSKFMNEMIGKIEEKFSTRINTYALICLASLKCNLQDYNLKICYEEFNKQALNYLKHFNFKYIDLVKTGIFDKIDDYNSVLIYDKANYNIMLYNGKLCTLLSDGVKYDIVATTSNGSKFSSVKSSYICKSFNNLELEVQVLKNNNFKIIGKTKLLVNYVNFEKIPNEEYIIKE